jgi:hypothetical protein
MNDVKLFEEKKVRTHWDTEKEIWYFSVNDVIEILTDSPRPREYWNALKTKLNAEGNETSQKLGQLNSRQIVNSQFSTINFTFPEFGQSQRKLAKIGT